jgi:hypothetical protein
MKKDNKTQNIQWHSPFRGAIKIELEPYKDILEYIDEKSITKKPLQIDLLVIRKPSDVKIENAIGRIFRAFNLMEYKSPTDYLSVDDFYRVSAYANLLKADAKYEGGILFGDLTISLVSSKPPMLVFEHLKSIRGYELVKQEAGIYYLNKEKEIPVQFIALDELSSEHTWLAALTNHITEDKLSSITADYNPAEKNEYKDSIMDTVAKANFAFIKKLREDNFMSKAWLEIFNPEIEAEVERRTQESNKKILEFKEAAQESEKKARDALMKVVIELNNMDITITQIAKITELPEAKIQDILKNLA